MVRACTRTTGASCRTSSSRRCAARTSLIYGDGNQTRSFCYVDDLVDGLIRLMNSGDEVTGPINLGNPVEFTMRQLAELVLELTGGKSGLVHRPLPSDDPRQRQPDITLAKQHLDWTPTAPLKVGLMRTIEYFDALLKAA
jgi:UDP-glucuronate decarboxylase